MAPGYFPIASNPHLVLVGEIVIGHSNAGGPHDDVHLCVRGRVEVAVVNPHVVGLVDIHAIATVPITPIDSVVRPCHDLDVATVGRNKADGAQRQVSQSTVGS